MKYKSIKVSVETHEKLRTIAFKKKLKIKLLIELLLKKYHVTKK